MAVLVLFVIMYKRRVFLRGKFKYRNIGLPMITSMWNKSNRFYTAVTFGLIAYNIYNIVMSVFNAGSSQSDIDIRNLNDRSGIVKLLFRICQVIVVGISKKNMLSILYCYQCYQF